MILEIRTPKKVSFNEYFIKKKKKNKAYLSGAFESIGIREKERERGADEIGEREGNRE